jgi:WD40 repeat protein
MFAIQKFSQRLAIRHISCLAIPISSAILGLLLPQVGVAGEPKSALDKYDQKNINPLEKFTWQPPELVAIFGEHRGRHGGAVTALAYSRNGKMLVSGSDSGIVRFWDPVTMRLQHRLTQSGGTWSLAFSKDNTLLVGGGGDGSVQLWDVAGDAPKDKESFKVSSLQILAVALAPSGKTLAAGSGDNRLTLWDLTQTPPREISSSDMHNGPVTTLAFALDGKTLASGSADKTVRLWSILKDNKLKEKAVVEAHPGGVRGLAYHPVDDKTLVTGGSDGTVRFWHVAGGKLTPRAVLKGDGSGVQAVAFAPNGKTLASAHGSGTCRTWTVGDVVKEKAILEGHAAPASAVAFSADGATLYSGSHDWTVRQWPAAASAVKPRDKTVTKGHLSQVYTMSFAPDGKSLVSGGQDQTIRVWDLTQPEAKERLPNIKAEVPIQRVVHAPGGKVMAGAGAAVNFRTYDTGTRRFIYTFNGHKAPISALAYAPDGGMIATAGQDKTVRLWNPKNGREIYALTAFEAPVHSVAFSPDGNYLLTTSGTQVLDKKGQAVVKDGANIYQDSTVRLYDVSTKKEVFRWKDDKVLPVTAAFEPGGGQFLVGSTESWLRGWSWPEPRPTDPAIVSKAASALSPFCFSPDGRYFAAVAGGGIGLFEAATGKRLRHWVLQENLGNVAFAPDSRHLTISLGTGVIYLLRLEAAGAR